MPADVELCRRDGIELVRTGNWTASTGKWNPTREDILSAVKAQECPAVRRPRLKLGHTDERFNGDGEPSLGWFENLRAGDGGHTLLGDQVALPWLNQVQAAAYPDRSIEGAYRYRCGLGHEHPFVLTAVALLGVTPPAVSTLKSVQDLPGMLGVAAAVEVPDGAERVAVTVYAVAETNEEPLMSRAQRIRDAWNASNPPLSQWVQEARSDAAVVVDDADRTYRLYPVTWADDEPVFGEPQPYDPEADKPLVFASRVESRPDQPQPDAPEAGFAAEPVDGEPIPDEPPPLDLPAAEPEHEINPDPKEDRVSTDLSPLSSRLGLADDADMDAIAAAVDELKSKADEKAEPTPEMVAASAAATKKAEEAEAEKDELRKEVTVLASQVKTMSDELASSRAEKFATVKASVLDTALKEGKFKPADRAQWEADYDEAPGAITRVLASIAPGTAVPVTASGTIGAPEPTGDNIDAEYKALTARLDGPNAKAV